MLTSPTEMSSISIEDFRKLDLRVGRINTAETIPGADRLLRLLIDIGVETRQIVAGIAPRYQPNDVTGKSVIVVCNLKAVKIRGVESQGMILAAGDKEVHSLATFFEPPPPGTRVK